MRLGLSLLIATLVGAGMWAVIVVLPEAQVEFGVDRAAASLPYTLMMCGLAFGTIALGRMADRSGMAAPLAVAVLIQGAGFVLAGAAPNLVVFSAAHVLIGVGTGTGFGPLMADVSHWFVRRRGLAVVVVASGNYLAGGDLAALDEPGDAADRLARDLRRHRTSSSPRRSCRSPC